MPSNENSRVARIADGPRQPRSVASPFLGARRRSVNFYIAAVRIGLHTLQAVAPTLAGKVALAAFLTPPRHRPGSEERKLGADACTRVVKVRGARIHVNIWGQGPCVHLVHGWGGRSTQLWPIINDLVSAGYRVMAHDGPAHGASSGRRTDMWEYAEAIAQVARQAEDRVVATISHSFGAANTVLAIDRFGLNPGKLVLIACFDNAAAVTDLFGARFGIRTEVIAGMRTELERRYGFEWSWSELVLSNMLSRYSGPVLLIHDRDDAEISFENLHALSALCAQARKVATQGFGHRRVLRCTSSREAILDFLGTDERAGDWPSFRDGAQGNV